MVINHKFEAKQNKHCIQWQIQGNTAATFNGRRPKAKTFTFYT